MKNPTKKKRGGGGKPSKSAASDKIDSGPENFSPSACDEALANQEESILILCSFECNHCQEPMAEVASYHLSKECPRCGWENRLERHETFKCHECGDEFTFPSKQAKAGAWCFNCGVDKRIEALGRINWELSPRSEGHPMFATETERVLFGEDERGVFTDQEARQGGIYNAYKNATPHDRRKLGSEAKLLAEHVLRFMVALAVDFEDYDAVRWLAQRADFGRRRFPDDAHQNLGTMLTDPKRPSAKREWQEVRDWVSKGKAGGPKAYSSPLPTMLNRLCEKASRWRHFDILSFRKARQNPCMKFSEPQEEHERRLWIEFLQKPFWQLIQEDGSNANVVLKQIPFPEKYVSSIDDRACAENLRDEVLMPILKALRRLRKQAWKDDRLPTDDAELKRRVDVFLRLRAKSRGKQGGKCQS